VIPGCSELIIRRVTVSDVGLYQCQSVNGLGSDVQTATVDVGCELEPHVIVVVVIIIHCVFLRSSNK